MDIDSIDVAILLFAALAALASVAAARNWRGSAWLKRSWTQADPYVGCYVRRAPATFTYAAIITVTTWVIAGAGTKLSHALLRSQSTNIDNLRSRPVAVLFRSAFWSGEPVLLPVLALLVLVLAPAEMWLGTGRLILVFAIGHVGATLIAVLAIEEGFFGSPTKHGLVRTVDVGVSYGVFCVAAILTYRLPKQWRLWYAGALLTIFGVFAFAIEPTFTDFGHFASVLIGLALFPLVRSDGVTRRSKIPIYRPWLDPATVRDS